MKRKTEVAFYWDWKAQPQIIKIVEAVQRIGQLTGKKVNCYEVNTKSDSYGILITIGKYTDEETIRKKWNKLFCKQEKCQEISDKEFLNGDLTKDIEKIQGYDERKIIKYQFTPIEDEEITYTIEVNDQSYFYVNKSDRNDDYKKLKKLFPK